MSTVDSGNGTIALAFDGVCSGYVQDIDILKDISLVIPAGSLHGLIGLNGAGKSTTLMTAIGFVPLHAGRISLHGEDISNILPHRCIDRGLYMLPQQSSLFPYMSVRHNLEFIARRRGSDIAMAVDLFSELKPYLRRRAGNLSGGWQKMVEFAKALLAKPRVLLVDEPSVGLSPNFARRVYDWIDLIRQEGDVSILLVDHNIERVVELADYMHVLSLGSIVAEGETGMFSGDLRTKVREWLGMRNVAGHAQS